ncbi:MAG: S49 family peptidase, partial [Betaproteobacteria bacterium]|nr:S49 family peptidase [Betaproteobacteria bacterium]
MTPDPLNNEPSTNQGKSSVAATWERETLERLVMAQIQEQRVARRWQIGFRLVWVLLILAGFWYSFHHNKAATSANPQSHTALIEIKGEIDSDSSANAEWVMDSLRQAFEDEGAQAIVLRIDSPGGSPVQAGMINDEVRRLKALHKKPVYAVVEETCASAAYYIAVSADQIFVDKASIVGSIGVLMDGFGFTGLMDKVGVERRLMTAGENKGFLDPFSTPNKHQRNHAQNLLDQIHRQFIQVVREGRGTRLKETPEMFSGLFWSGQQAVELGLADGFGSLDSVARDLVKAEDIVDYTRQDNVAERLAKRFGAAMGEAMVKTSLSMV